MKRISIIITIILQTLWPISAISQWAQTNGPYGGTVNALFVNSGRLFAGTTGGVYLSTNGGSSWSPASAGLTTGDTKAFTINGSNIFAGTNGGGVFLSTDNGSSWSASNSGLPGSCTVNALTVLSGTVFAGTAFQGVYASIDNGNSWTAVNTGLTTTSISALVVNGTSLFAGTNAGVFISVNGGSSWSPANTGLSNTTVQSMAVTGSLIFAGTSSGVFSSSNNGANWSQVYNGGSVYSMAASSSNVFAGTNGGVVYSSNSGSSWGTVNNGLTNTIVFSLTIDGSNTYAGTMGGVFHTVNNGASWTEANAGITGTYIYTLAINGTSIYAGTATQGIYLSTNNGSAWTPVNSGLTTLKIRAIAFNGSNLFAGTFGGGVFLSTNGGSNWTAVNSGLSNTSVNALAITGSNIFAGTDGGGVFLSSNNGSSWSQVNSGLSGGLFVNALAVNGSNIFAGTNGGGVFLSTNNGGSWTPVNTGLTSTTVNSLAVSGSSTFAGTMGGVFLSTNNGSSWTAMNTGLTSTYVPVLSVSDNKIFAGTDLGIFMANAAGGSWTAINAGLSAPYVHALSCTSSGVFAGSYPGSVWLRSFLDFVPAISSFSPASGSVGTSVTISGSYFDPNVSNNVVHFGATRAIVNSATSSQLQVTVPSGSTYEPISVTVNGLTAYASQPFLVTVTNLAALNATAFAANVDFAAGNLNAVALADIDGDGRTDILTANNSSSKLSVFRNTATSGVINTGSFAAVVEFASASQPNSIATGDLDGDGKLDVVVGSLSGTISVYVNTSTSGVINSSSLAPKVDLTSLTPRGVAIRDLDKDGKPDIIVVNGTGSGSTLSVFRNISTIGTISASSFDPKVDYTVTIGLSTGLYVGDFDGDGKPDVGTSNDLSSTISILRNNSVPGGFSASSFDAKVEFASGYNPKGITGGDIDGDGKIDLVTSNGVGTVSIFKNSSTGSGSILFVKNDTGSMGGGQIVLGDIDADGLPDLAGGGVAAKNTSIPGSLTFASNVVFNTASQPTGCSISDLDGDGIADLAISTFGGSSISVIRNLLTVVPPPTITGFNPQSGYPLSQVTITGTNFNPDPINNTVSFNGVAGTVSTSITTSIVAVVPATATTGPISVKVGTNTATSTGDFTVLQDNTGPALSNNATSSVVVSGQSLVVTATFADPETGVKSVQLQYRPVAGASPNDYTTANMSSTVQDTFTATIPSSSISELGVEYRFVAMNGVGTTTSSAQPIQVVVRYSSGLPISSYPSSVAGTEVSNYRIIGIPLNLDSKTANNVFSSALGNYDPTVWRMFRYNGSSTTELTGTSDLVPGDGYWFITSTKASLTTPAGNTVNGVFLLHLNPGWNQIGNPYNFNISWADVIAANPTETANLGGNSSKIRVYRGSIDNVDVLKVMEGGFVKYLGTSASSIAIPVARNSSIQGRQMIAADPAPSVFPDLPSWEMNFRLRNADTEYHIGGIGMHPEANEGFDFHDDFIAPRFIEYLEMVMPKKYMGMIFTKDVVPVSDNYTWRFAVESNLTSPITSISWIKPKLNGRLMVLLDVKRQKAIDLTTTETYTFDQRVSGEFRIILGNENYVRSELVPSAALLLDPFPNPFENDIYMEFSLPQEVALHPAELTIYGVDGERISSVSIAEPGHGRWLWKPDGLPAGLYLIKLTAGNQTIMKKVLKR